MQQCGFCSMLSGLLRRAMCVGSRRGSSDSYYRELGDQDTLKIEDRSSDFSEASEQFNAECRHSGSFDFREELDAMGHRKLCTGRFLTMHKRRKKRLLTRSLCQEAALLDDLHIGQVQCILDQSVQWRFNAFTLEIVSGGRCLPVLCVHLFHIYGLLNHFKLDVSKAWKLFCLIEEGYHSTNPYHNTVHAADVTQAMHCFLQQDKIRCHMEPLEIMASLIAAIAHDVDHPGVNQPFLIATSNHLAALYRNTSVLENHHWRSAMSCLIESGLIDQLDGVQAILEKQISSLILATDITRQQEYLSQFKAHMDTNTLDLRNKDHRHLVLQIALKCADISNPCRPWEISQKWSLKVCEEFFRQGDYERKLNLPVTALCDRHSTSIPKIQTGFFKFVVTPLISEWHRFLQNDLSAQMLQNLLYNQNKWEELMAQEIAEETQTEISDADMVDDDLETYSGTNVSESSELLLPRRSSLNPAKQGSFKDHIRRFSAPLNVFQDSKFKNRERSQHSFVAESRASDEHSVSVHSINSQLSVHEQCEPESAKAEKVLSTERLLPDTSIASITTPLQATRISSVLREGGSKLLRQQTFPPLEPHGRQHTLAHHTMYTSYEDTIYNNRRAYRLTDSVRRDKGKHAFDDSADGIEKENVMPGGGHGYGHRRESAPVGSQLRENLAALQHAAFAPDQLLRRRKSMPAETLTCAARERKLREVTSALLRRTLSGKEWWPRRRGSAPATAPLDRHGSNGGRRKPSPIAACHQWLAKTTYTVHERTMHHLPRRSSLPVEVLTGGPHY